MKSAAEIIAGLAEPKPQAKPIGKIEPWATWFGFDLRNNSPEMIELVQACAQFCAAMKAGTRPYWLSLLGSSGAGKTFLAKRIFRWHRDCGLFSDRTANHRGAAEVEYAREWCWWPGLARLLKGNDGYGELSDMESASFSVIDEIGAELDKSGHVTNCLSNSLSARVGKWTLITSNQSLSDIERTLDARVASRMVRDGSDVIHVNVEDYSLWQKRPK